MINTVMNLNELDNFQITDAINFNSDLNPQLFLGERMRSTVRTKLMDIADHFREFLGVEDIALVDITVSGSNAAYSYTPYSDIDLHLIVDFSQLPDNDVYREMFDAKKYQYNDQHDIKIKGYDVELYVQDAAQPHVSLGNYSVLNDDWNRFPTKQRANVDEESTYFKYNKLKQLALMALASDNEQYLNNVLDIVKRYRRAGLAENGEFGPENLAFKLLRKEGYFKKLWAKKRQFTTLDLSLEQVQDEPDTDLEKELANEFTTFGKRTAEDIIRELYNHSETLFDEYDYDNIYSTAESIGTLDEAEYEGNIGAMEVFKFYQEAEPSTIDLVTRLIAAHKQKEAWQVIQKVTGTNLKGKEFAVEGSHRDITPYKHLQDDIIDVYNYVLDYYNVDSDTLDISDFEFTKQVLPLSSLESEIKPLLKKYAELGADAKRVAQIEQNIDTSYPLYVHEGHLIAGTHRAVVYAKMGLEKVIVYNVDVEEGELPDLYEGVGIIVKGVNTTDDVDVYSTKREADKLNLACNKDGIPALLKTDGKSRTVDNIMEGVINELDMSPGGLQKQANQLVKTANPVLGLEFEVCIEVDKESNPDITEYTDISDLQELIVGDDTAWQKISDQHMTWVQEEKEPEWVATQVQEACNTPGYNDREKLEFMVNDYTHSIDADSIIESIYELMKEAGAEEYDESDNENLELTETIARATLDKAHKAYKMVGNADEWPVDESTNPYIRLYHEIFVEDDDEAKQMLSDIFYPDFWESEFPHETEYSVGSWLLKNQIKSYREVLREFGHYGLWSDTVTQGGDYSTGGFDYEAGQNMAYKMGEALGHEVEVYDEADMNNLMSVPDHWIITSDSSIKPDGDDDSGMEIIMPPTEYEDAIEDIKNMYNFLKREGAYTNESTGLHINVSMAAIDHNQLDYAKLVLLVGDKTVAKKFGREFSTMAENSLQLLGDYIDASRGYEKDRPMKAKGHADMMGKMRNNLNKALMSSFENVDFGKFTSVGIKDNRIEFRSVGGNYLHGSDFQTLLNTVNRFVVAYAVACDPEAHKKEYAKKLYKLATNVGLNDTSGDAKKLSKLTMTLFASFNSGIMDKDTLIKSLKDIRATREAQRSGEAPVDTGEAIPKPKTEREAIEAIANRYGILDMQAEMRWMEGMEAEMGRLGDPKKAAKAAFKNLYNDISHYFQDIGHNA